MVLFIVMFAMSTVDVKKYAALKDGLADGFGATPTILKGENPMKGSQGAADPGSPSYDQLIKEIPQPARKDVTEILRKADQMRKEQQEAAAKVEVDRLLQAWKKIDRELRRKGLRQDVRATIDERGLVVSLVSRHVVFLPDVAELTTRGRRVVDTLAPVLLELPEPLELDGHTNQERVKPKYYPTDWELSLARAANVLRRLQEADGLPAGRLRATGFGHTKPLVDPDRKGSQLVNKRVDIVVLSQAAAETRALLGQAYDDVRRQASLDESDSSSGSQPAAAARPVPEEKTP
jgi:chemotaxis protein MotB